MKVPCQASLFLLASVFLLATGLIALRAGHASAVEHDRSSPPARPIITVVAAKGSGRIEVLVNQLGSDEYVVRRRAEARLLEHGADAFDALQSAEQHPDLEISSRAQYLLHQIRIEWIEPSDSPEVRRVMARYGELSRDQRRQRIDQLAAFPEGTGHSALARITRFDTSPRLARHAALAILSEEKPQSAAQLRDEIGESQRVPIEWLRVFADGLERPGQLDPRWLSLIDAELELLADESADTDAAIVERLLQFHIELCLKLSDSLAIFETLRRQTEFQVTQGRTLQLALLLSLEWLLDHQQWPALQLLEDHYDETIRHDRLLMYYLAVARSNQGREEIAQELADRAFELDDDRFEQRLPIADRMANKGRHDWAQREWRYVIDELPAIDIKAIQARKWLAIYCLHDQGKNLEAAELLGESCDAIDENIKVKRARMADHRIRSQLNTLFSQKEFFRACHAESQGNFDEQRQFLEKSYRHNPIDADVLIAMYSVENADDAYRKKVKDRILATSKKLENDIKSNPKDDSNYNHWAWLISNTEGDFQKALRYSHHSLELSPGSASYLDTLGRCYYAVGDLENALKYQRQAIAKHPQLQVMQRQLELFERESRE